MGRFPCSINLQWTSKHSSVTIQPTFLTQVSIILLSLRVFNLLTHLWKQIYLCWNFLWLPCQLESPLPFCAFSHSSELEENPVNHSCPNYCETLKEKMLLFKYPNFLLTFSKIQEMISRCLFTTNEIFRVPTFPNWQNSRISPGIFSLLAQLFHERLAYVIIIPPNETWSLMSLTMWMMHYERHWQDLANFHEIL